MGEIIKYMHHGNLVSVDSDLLGKHRKHCLCYSCDRFTIPYSEQVSLTEMEKARSRNCPKSNKLFDFVVEHGMVTPVYECGDFGLR